MRGYLLERAAVVLEPVSRWFENFGWVRESVSRMKVPFEMDQLGETIRFSPRFPVADERAIHLV